MLRVSKYSLRQVVLVGLSLGGIVGLLTAFIWS
jgi:hypothetical protein